jgi:5-methyltetrahydropteroyltriglutamate--homocysteine methyltransferase
MTAMRVPLIPTTIIGSLPKPGWLTSEWYSVVERWNLAGAALAEAQDDATRLALADQEAAGIDIVCDGEQRRSTHYSYFLAQLEGVDRVELKAKSMRGGKFTQEVPRVTGPLTLANHQCVEDYRFLRALTARPIKMTLPGPSTLVDGTSDQYYGDDRTLALAYADVINREIRALQAAGCEQVQLDEPVFTRLPEKLDAWGVEALDRAFEGTSVHSCVHVCYGYRARLGNKEWKHGYEEIFPSLARAGVEQYSLEFAEPGLSPAILAGLPGKIIQLGVIDVGTEAVETAETVAARLRAALEILPAERLIAAPDCGCVARSREAARGKLRALTQGAGIVRRELGQSQRD